MSESSAGIVKVVIVILALAAVAILVAAVIKGGKTENAPEGDDESYSENVDEDEEDAQPVDYEFEDAVSGGDADSDVEQFAGDVEEEMDEEIVEEE